MSVYDDESLSENERIHSVNRKRKETPCFFKDGISREEFEKIARRIGKRLRRVKNITVEGPIIYCTAESQTGFTTWDFNVDFNDWGHVTGIYWTQTDNEDSSLPMHYAQMVSEAIHNYLSANGISLEDYSYYVNLNQDLDTSNGLAYQEKTGFFFGIFRRGTAFAFIGNDSEELLHEHLYPVISKIKANGFKNIKSVPIYDVNYHNNKYLFEVEQIIIGGTGFFRRGDSFPDTAEVIITYHDKQHIIMPFTEVDFKNTDHIYVRNCLQNSGFINIYERRIEDLITGWITKDGSVERVLVNAGYEVPIVKGKSYQYDIKLVICYHTFKK